MHCHLLIPGLRLPHSLHQEIDPALRLPALQALLIRGERTETRTGDSSEWLCHRFGSAKQQDWPVAPITLWADGIEPGPHYWLRADPVHLRVSRDRLIVADSQLFSLTLAEAQALVATLNQHFVSDGWEFFAPAAERWYLRLEQAPALETQPLAKATGDFMDAHLPSGKDAQHWRKIINEIQMLLHEHPVNLEREARGELAINSAWLWGGGSLVQPPVSAFASLWADDPLARAFAWASNTPCADLPENASIWLEEHHSETGDLLIVLDSLNASAQYGDARRWMEAASALEQHWFAPLKQALAAGRLKKMTLHAPGAHGALEITTNRKNLWRIWRRAPLLSVLA